MCKTCWDEIFTRVVRWLYWNRRKNRCWNVPKRSAPPRRFFFLFVFQPWGGFGRSIGMRCRQTLRDVSVRVLCAPFIVFWVLFWCRRFDSSVGVRGPNVAVVWNSSCVSSVCDSVKVRLVVEIVRVRYVLENASLGDVIFVKMLLCSCRMVVATF